MLKFLIPKVTEVETVKRGRYYSVPCVQVPECVPMFVGEFRSGDWIPTLDGSLHSDPEIGANYQHFHYDRRFCKDRIPAQSVLAFGVPGQNLLWPNADTVIDWKRRKCYSPTDETFADFAQARIIKKLEDIHEKCRLWGNLCPHRNISLNGIPTDDNGNVTCPAHGLTWNKASGELVRERDRS